MSLPATSHSSPPPPQPHMGESEIRLLTTLLGSCGTLLEYGSGGSTLLALSLPDINVTSVESDKKWLQKLRESAPIALAEQEGRLKLNYINIGPVRSWGAPADKSGVRDWPNYSQQIWKDARFSPDLILVDGRFRAARAYAAALHMRPDARLLIHDFWNRYRYWPVLIFFKCVASADTLAVFERRRFAPWPALRPLLWVFQYNPQ